MNNTTASRYHDISVGHRVAGHESKCQHLHGHNYRITFEIGASELDKVGRVLDFGVIKSLLCMWLEDNWDHKMLIWENDPLLPSLLAVDNGASIVITPFNPTAENMGEFIGTVVGPQILPQGTNLVSVIIEETRKCSTKWTL